MTGFQKPQALKAALKMALYGPAGSGKPRPMRYPSRWRH
jgi:hypothetical protein